VGAAIALIGPPATANGSPRDDVEQTICQNLNIASSNYSLKTMDEMVTDMIQAGPSDGFSQDEVRELISSAMTNHCPKHIEEVNPILYGTTG